MTAPGAAPLVQVRDLVKHYPGERTWLGLGRPRAPVRAVDGVSFSITAGRTLGLVGESGSGKTTVARTLLRLTEPTSGTFLLDAVDVFALAPGPLRRLRRRLQIVFQDPFGSLNPRMTVRQTLREPLAIHDLAPKSGRDARVDARTAALKHFLSFRRAFDGRKEWIARADFRKSGPKANVNIDHHHAERPGMLYNTRCPRQKFALSLPGIRGDYPVLIVHAHHRCFFCP